jgi:hypothetical protein
MAFAAMTQRFGEIGAAVSHLRPTRGVIAAAFLEVETTPRPGQSSKAKWKGKPLLRAGLGEWGKRLQIGPKVRQISVVHAGRGRIGKDWKID